jgi:hypothetical protein
LWRAHMTLDQVKTTSTLVQLRGVTGAAVGRGPPPQTRHRQDFARVTVMLIIITTDCCRSVLTERRRKIARYRGR